MGWKRGNVCGKPYYVKVFSFCRAWKKGEGEVACS